MAITRVRNFQRQGPKAIDRLAIGWSGGISAAAGQLSQLLFGTKTWDPGSVAAAGQVSTTVTVTGAVLGDFLLTASFSLDLQLLFLSGYVSAADTVTILLQNHTAGAIDLASGTLDVIVVKGDLTT